MTERGIYLTWQSVTAYIKDKAILTNVTGKAVPGTTMAIMGPSGAGKTTLLSILAKKNGPNMKVAGTILANQETYTTNDFYGFASYVYQNDILNEVLTVRETLEFTAKLKIKGEQEALSRVDELINQFMLKKCEDTKVGGKIIKGISGGEKKRLCIAIQVIAKPSLLILDEPTSGLDSYMANSIIKILNKLAKEDNKTILFTIHQPSYKIYSELDQLLLLDRGNCIYQGKAAGIADYMVSLGIKIPAKTTICDFFMFEISEYKQRTEKYETLLTAQQFKKRLQPAADKEITSLITENQFEAIPKQTVSQSFGRQFSLLLQREIKIFFRNPMKFGRAVGNAILMIILLGLIFINAIKDNRPSPNQPEHFDDLIKYFIGAQGVSFIAITSTIMTGIFSVALVFPVEREVFAKEVASKTYNSFTYFISKLIIQVVTLWFGVMLFCAGGYWFLGYRHDAQSFFTFSFILIGAASVGSSIGLLTGSFFKDAQKATSMAPALILPMMMFSGLYNRLSEIPGWIRWVQYISPFRYGLHAILLNQFRDETYPTTEGLIFDYKVVNSIHQTLWQNTGMLFLLSLLYYSLAYICLRGLSNKLTA